MPPRSLIVDSRGVSGRDRARSRSEALHQLTLNEYDTIELYTRTPGRDDYDLITYLAATWPTFLQRVTVRTITAGRPSSLWNQEAARFVLATPAAIRPPSRRRPVHEQNEMRSAALG
jgi:hypothetical protein